MQSYSDVEAQERPIEPERPPFSLGTGLLTWLVSVVLIVGLQVIIAIVYVVGTMMKSGGLPNTETMKPENILTVSFALLAIGATFVAHLATLLFCWLLITKRLQLPFLQTMGWHWHPKFKWGHAIALGVVMMGVALLFGKILPHHETDLEKMLRLGLSVRIVTALLAVFSAPFVEEFVYRGILYPAVEGKAGWAAGIVVTSLLFALVHVPQYWGSPAAITVIMVLSVVLTSLRAYTGSVLPSVATHFVYNGIQSVALLFGLDDATKEQTKQALVLGVRWLTGG